MIPINSRVIVQGRYLGSIDDAVEVHKGEHITWAYRVRYRSGVLHRFGWFLARDVVNRTAE